MLNPLSLLKHPVLLSLYFISSLASAQNFSSAASDGTGGAGRASVDSNDVNYLNPAGLVHLKGRFIGVVGSKEDLSLSLSDASREAMIPGSLAFFQKKFTDESNRKIQWQQTRLTIADFAFSKFSVGLTGIMGSVKVDDQKYNQTNGNLGVFFTPLENMGAGLVSYNVFGVNKKVPSEFQMKRQLGAGINYIYKSFLRYRLDVQSAPNENFGKATYMTGFESLINEWLVFRGGYQNDLMAERELWTAGAGFSGPVFALNYAYQGSIKGANFNRHSIDLLVAF